MGLILYFDIDNHLILLAWRACYSNDDLLGKRNVILYLNKKDYKVNSREKNDVKKFKNFFGHKYELKLGFGRISKRRNAVPLKKHCNWKVSR